MCTRSTEYNTCHRGAIEEQREVSEQLKSNCFKKARRRACLAVGSNAHVWIEPHVDIIVRLDGIHPIEACQPINTHYAQVVRGCTYPESQ